MNAIRYTLRTIRLHPTFAIVAILTLAIVIGANTAIFSVVNGVLIKPLAYPEPEQLVGVWHNAPGAAITDMVCSPSTYFTYRDESETFQHVGLWSTGGSSVTGVGEPEQVRTLFVTYGTLQALGIEPVLGRMFSREDDTPGSPESPVVLTYGYWQRHFGADQSVIGRNMIIDSRQRVIIGVMPRAFRFFSGDPELIIPFRFDRNRAFLGNFSYQGIARLKPGVTIAQANADVDRMLTIWVQTWPVAPGTTRQAFENWKAKSALRPLKQDIVGNTGNMLWVLMGSIAMVLVIACANVANLLLVRAESRRRELAIRKALGAGWARMVQDLLAESLLLGLLGGAFGLGLAYAGLGVLRVLGPSNLTRLAEVQIDPVVLGFVLVASLVSGLFFGLIPALKFAAPQIGLSVRSGRTDTLERHRTRQILVVVQVSLAMVLLVSAGLMIRSLRALNRVEPGFTAPGEIQTLRISLPASQIQQPEQVTRKQN